MNPEAQHKLDEYMMRRALREARRGRPSPNPHVGAVIARGEHIVSVGHHAAAGRAHAEALAIRRAGAAARGATLYVTLEPCNHYGRTPPCTEAILTAGVKRVVVGFRDPAPHVPGGAAKLKSRGVDVAFGVCEPQARALVADFTKHITTGLPYVTLKAAISLDGRMATRTHDSKWISGERSRNHAHRMRDQSDAVAVGIGTVLADDPQLTVRRVRGRDPIRVVFDSHLRISERSALVRHDSRAPTVVFCRKDASKRRIAKLVRNGVEICPVRATRRGISLKAVLRELGRRNVVRLLVEGGPTLHGAFLDEHLADAAALFIAPIVIGDARAPGFASGRGVRTVRQATALCHSSVRQFGEDVLIQGELKTSRESCSRD